MKTKLLIILALLPCASFAQILAPGQNPPVDLVPLQIELSQLRQQIQIQNNRAVAGNGQRAFIPDESDSQREARHQAAIERMDAEFADKQRAQNPHIFSGDIKKLSVIGGKQYVERAIQESDAQAMAQYKAREQGRSNALQTRIASIERKLAVGNRAVVPAQRAEATAPPDLRESKAGVGWKDLRKGMSKAAVEAVVGSPNIILNGEWRYTDRGGALVFGTDGLLATIK